MMTLDLTQTNNQTVEKKIEQKGMPLALKEKLKQKVEARKIKIPDKILKARERRKKNAMATNLTANVDYIPTSTGIFISKIDYKLESETDDGYIFRKIKQSEIKKAELMGVFAKRKLIIGDIREKLKQNRGIINE